MYPKRSIAVAAACCLLVSDGNRIDSTGAISQPPVAAVGIAMSGLQPGDILLRRGVSWASATVLAMDHRSFYSHAGIIITRGGRQAVVHVEPAVGHGQGYAVVEPVDHFLGSDRAVAAAVYRLNENSALIGPRVASIAESYAASRVPFDNDFDARSSERIYCTEMVWRVFREQGLDIAPDFMSRPRPPLMDVPLILISDIQDSPFLHEVTTQPRTIRRDHE